MQRVIQGLEVGSVTRMHPSVCSHNYNTILRLFNNNNLGSRFSSNMVVQLSQTESVVELVHTLTLREGVSKETNVDLHMTNSHNINNNNCLRIRLLLELDSTSRTMDLVLSSYLS